MQPIPLTPGEIAEDALDRGLDDALHQEKWDTRHHTARQRYQDLGIYGK